MTKKQKKMLYRILIAAVLFLAAKFIPMPMLVSTALYFAAYVTIGYDILRKAWKGICNHQVFDENFLMAVATIGAIALAIYEKSGDYAEAVAVMLFYQIGELFQSYAVGKSRRNITALMDIRPDYANIEHDGKLDQVDPDDVAVGTVITVQPGEKIPIDGEIVEGASTLNTAALTGESLPRDVMTGDEVISGCINMTGVLKVKTTKAFGESTVSKILELMENSSSHKSRSEAFISRFARVYTPAVCYSALALAILPPVINLLMGNAASWGVWIYRALTFLVISCPCALVISIPLSFFAGLGGAGHEGILIKGSNYLEALSKTKIVVFDKTGTLTQGVFEVTGVHHSPMEDRKLLEYAALAECASSHPISKSLQKACGVELDRSRVTDIEERGGRGVVATVDGHSVAAGNGKLMDELGVKWQECRSVGTIVHMAVDGEYAGHIVISDVVKSDARDAIAALKRAGVQKTVAPAGMVIAIIREDLIREDLDPKMPIYMRYDTHAKNDSMYNTPNCWAIYCCGKVFKYLKSIGGLEVMHQRNIEKAKVIYDFLDSSKMFHGTVEPEFRSLMNIPFVTDSAELDAEVVAATKAAGYDNLKGHKSVGGLRASVYNAMPIEGAQALVEFLKKFEAEHTK